MEKTQSSVISDSAQAFHSLAVKAVHQIPVQADHSACVEESAENAPCCLRIDAAVATPKKFRIAMIRQQFRFDGGGEQIVSRMKSILEKQGHDVCLITRKWQADPEAKTNSVICCNPRKWTRVQRESRFAKQAMQQVANNQFDLVQSHERIPGCQVYRAGDGVHASWLEQRARTMNRLSRYGVAISGYHRYLLKAEKELFEHPKLRAVICNSKMVQQEIAERFSIDRSKLKLIYNGVDTEKFHPRLKKNRTQIRKNLNIPEAAPLFLFVGSGFERKGANRLLHAIQKIPNGYAVIVGRDSAIKKSKQLSEDLGIADRVRFVGAQKQVTPYYGAADVFVLPTLYDPFPNSILEAMAAGLPVVTSTKCGGAEFIQNGKNGFVCDALNRAALVPAMRQMTSLPLVEQAGIEARKTVEPFSLIAMNDQLTGLYQTLLTNEISE